ncbi:MAG: hypothetical protein RQ952_04555 [Thermoproteota archaeon]|nr:hypothetical protein [Thermoproteota archaeon]
MNRLVLYLMLAILLVAAQNSTTTTQITQHELSSNKHFIKTNEEIYPYWVRLIYYVPYVANGTGNGTGKTEHCGAIFFSYTIFNWASEIGFTSWKGPQKTMAPDNCANPADFAYFDFLVNETVYIPGYGYYTSQVYKYECYFQTCYEG